MSEFPDSPIRLVVVDDHEMVREGLASMVDRLDQLEIVGSVATSKEAVAVISAVLPDIALVDIRLRGESGLELCRTIVSNFPDVAVVCLTVSDDEQFLFEALRSGAKGFLLKRVTAEGLVTALSAIASGETVIDPLLSGRVAKVAAASQGHGLYWRGMGYGLTKRESEVLQVVSEGFSNREIAERLFISEETVKSHLKSTYRKLSVSDRAEAIALAIRESLVR